MKISEATQNKITTIVKTYIELFPADYEAFKRYTAWKVSELLSKHGELKGSDIVHRKIAEYPEDLYTIFTKQLSVEEHTEMFSKEGQRWFVRKFPHFKAVELV